MYQVKFNGTVEYTLKYDGNGRLYSMTEGNTTHIYEYDSLDRLIRAWQKDSNGNNVVAVENTYDSLGRAKGSTYVVNGKEMFYDITYKADSSLVASVGMPDADILMSAINYTYDNFDRLTTKDISLSNMTDIFEDYAYYTYTGTDDKTHTTSLVSSVTLRISSGGTTTSTVYSYTYDNLGNITSVSKDGTLEITYSYDSLGQLKTEINRPQDHVYTYTYDNAGNIVQKTTYQYSTANVGPRVNYTYSNSAWGDLLTNYNGTTINYDAIGNPTNWRNATNLTWDGRQLAGLTLSNEDSFTYTYNSAGIRTQKQYYDFDYCGYYTYDYVLDGTNIISETVHRDNTKLYTLYYLYDESGSVKGFIYNNAYYYYQKNLQGDVVRIVNSGGTVVVEYTYDAWGQVLSVTGSQANTIGQYNSFRYRSYYYDTETGFYYLQSRYYDPTVGRFLNADGIIGANGGIVGYNMFAYCVNNPVMFCDYYGYCKTMWDEGYQGPCPGPGRCSDFDYDAYYEEQLETTGTIQTTKARDDNAKTSNINTFVNDETQHVSSLEFSMWFDSLTISSEMILTNTMHNSRLNLIDELTQVVSKSSRYTSSANGVVVLIMDVSSGIDKNIQNGAGLDKIAYDAYVDTCVTGSQVLMGIGIAAMCSNPVTAAIAGIVTCFLTVAVDEGFGIRDWFKSQYEG